MTDPVSLPVESVQLLACPVSLPPWDCEPGCLKGAVYRALRTGDLEALPVPHEAPLARHAARIAWLMCQDHLDPIDVDVGVPWMPGHHETWAILDGNHRLSAAILRGDESIEVNLGGCLRSAYEMMELPVPDFAELDDEPGDAPGDENTASAA